MVRRLLPYGPGAVLVECADRADTDALLRRLTGPADGSRPELITEIVPGARTLLLRLAGPLDAGTRTLLLTAGDDRPTGTAAPPLTVDVHYDGPDLSEVARQLEISTDEVVARHTGQPWTVAFAGFAPGFGYLQGKHADLTVARRHEPRTHVPAGSVALADVWSGVYPRPGPGGWQLIGVTDVVLFDLDRDPVALLTPGRTISFRAV